MPGATLGCRASIVPLYKDVAILEHSYAAVLQEYAFSENLNRECINRQQAVGFIFRDMVGARMMKAVWRLAGLPVRYAQGQRVMRSSASAVLVSHRVQLVVGKAEVVAHLVDYRLAHLFGELLAAVAAALVRPLVHGDDIGQVKGPVAVVYAALGDGRAVVQAQ